MATEIISFPSARQPKQRAIMGGTAAVLAFGPRQQPVAVMIERLGERTAWEGENDLQRTWPAIAAADLTGLQATATQGWGEIRVEVYQDGSTRTRVSGNVTPKLLEQAGMTINLIRAGFELGLWGNNPTAN